MCRGIREEAGRTREKREGREGEREERREGWRESEGEGEERYGIKEDLVEVIWAININAGLDEVWVGKSRSI